MISKLSFLLILLIPELSTAQIPSNETVYLPVKSIPSNLGPFDLQIASDTNIFKQLTEGLFAVGDGFRIDPKIVDTTIWSKDGKQLRLKLKKTEFSDGLTVTTSDIIKSLTHCLSNPDKRFPIAMKSIVGLDDFLDGKSKTISGLISSSEDDLVINLKFKSALLLDELVQPECNIVKPSKAGSWDLLSGAIGSGPYKIERRKSGEISILRNTLYSGRNEGPSRAIYRATEDFGDFNKIKDWAAVGTISESDSVPPEFNSFDSADLGFVALFMNNSSAPFENVAIRRALSKSFDYFAWAKALGISETHLQSGVIPFGMRGFKPRSKSIVNANIAAGRKEFASLGFSKSKPFRFTIYYSSSVLLEKEREAWSRAIDFSAVKIEFEVIKQTQLIAKLKNGDFAALRLVKYPGSVEPYRLLASFTENSTYNTARSSDFKCRKFVESAIFNEDILDRQKDYERADDCITNDFQVIPLNSLSPAKIVVHKPWQLTRKNIYLRFPYWIFDWTKQ